MAKKKTRAAETGGGPVHGEQRSGPVVGTAIVTGVTPQPKGLQYAEVDGQAMFEGDIVLGPLDRLRDADGAARPLQAIGITPGVNNERRWPNATIPFEIDPALPNQQRVHDAIAHWHANTRIQLRARAAGDADFVRFVPGGGCSSMIGRDGGMQEITLGSNCTAGNCIHEIGHTVGLWHEQSREDRDQFVQIIWANIDPSMQHNFNQHIADGDDLGAYDFGSIMHYPPTAFSINGQNTIVARVPLPAGVTMGQRAGLSAGDIAGVHMMYPGPTIKEVPKDPIQDPTLKEVVKDVNRDPVTVKETAKDPVSDPVTIKETRKDPITDPVTVKEVRKDPVTDPITTKEVARDPIGPIGPIGPGPLGPGGGAMPFLLATPSRFGGDAAIAEAAAQVQQLAEAIAAVEHQHAQLIAAYDAAVQQLSQLQGR